MAKQMIMCGAERKPKASMCLLCYLSGLYGVAIAD